MRLDLGAREREQADAVVPGRRREHAGDDRRALAKPRPDDEKLPSGPRASDDLDVHVLNNLRGAPTTGPAESSSRLRNRPMERSLYVVASGMVAELTRQQRIANDLANASTPGYKSETSTQRSFDDMLLFSRMSGAEVGDVGIGVIETPPQLDLTQGTVEKTGEPLDLALDGEGWFAVRAAQGVMFTRNGQFRTDASGAIVTADGLPVLGTDGREIRVKTAEPILIGQDGTVESGGAAVGKLAVVTLGNPQRAADGLYLGRNAGPGNASVRQGSLESSGLNAAATMVDMIVSLRAFEAGQRVIRAADETLQRAIASGATGA
ncbi:MAG: flagellar hook-basal body protein [Actinobacteria bacterium]|nr:flagellar hook-basal body protein [Actinomycetota bacterium]